MTQNIDPLAVLATDADVAGWMNEARGDPKSGQAESAQPTPAPSAPCS